MLLLASDFCLGDLEVELRGGTLLSLCPAQGSALALRKKKVHKKRFCGVPSCLGKWGHLGKLL